MSIRLSEDETWAELEVAHTGIFVTLRRDGWPIPLPVWFAALDQRLYIRTPAKSQKIGRISRDRRGSFLVERGHRWAELCAVMLPVTAHVVDAEEEERRAIEALNEKYQRFRTDLKVAGESTRRAYRGMTVIRLDPAGPALTWDNARLRLGSSAGCGRDAETA